MSKDLSFREKLARRAAASESDHASSYFPARLRIAMVGSFAQPVALAKLLTSNGLGLAKAHDAIGALANNRTVTVTLRPRDLEGLIEKIGSIGLDVSIEKRKGEVTAALT